MTDMATTARVKKKKTLELEPNPYTFRQAMAHGDPFTYLSIIVWGLGNIVHKQLIKGVLWLLVEATLIWYLVSKGFSNISGLGRLTSGGKKVTTIVNGFATEAVTTPSVSMLVFGMVSLFLCCFMVFLAWTFTRSAYQAQVRDKQGKVVSFKADMYDLVDAKHHNLLMSLPIMGILLFTVLPIIIMISFAFTSYDYENSTSFGWSLSAFKQLFSTHGGAIQGVNLGAFLGVLVWTIVWAILATFLNYFLGMWLAMLILRPGIKLKGMWRAFFAMSIAVPQFVSLMIINMLLQPQGVVNTMLTHWGWINHALPFFADPTWARATVVIINLWVGIPFTIMQVTGILQNVPGELYEAARIDGASSWTIYRVITLPYLFFVMTPYLITTFVANVNNFNVIYLLTQGGPQPSGAGAYSPGSTDLLITWLYKLSVNQGNYNVGAVIGIFTFIVLGLVSLITYQRSGSYRNEGGFN